MIKPEFNLLDEPWIRVRTRDCRVEEVSLKDVFVHAHEYEDLAGETAAAGCGHAAPVARGTALHLFSGG